MSLGIKKNLISYTLLLIGIVLLWVTANLSFGKEKWRGVLEADAKGYYAYLPAVFIYHDLNFGFFNKIEKDKYYQEHLFYDYRGGGNGKIINKYYAGTALAQLPFFLAAHGLTFLSAGEVDGYSKLYMYSVPVAAVFYCIIGLWFLAGLLRLYNVKDSVIALLLLVTVFGTHLFVYTVVESGMSHVFSFSFVCGFLFYSKRYMLQNRRTDILKMAFLFGLIVLCRPINALVLFFLIPLNGRMTLLHEFLKNIVLEWKTIVMSVTIFCAIISIQLIIYKISTGKFLVYSYQDEGFNFSDPHFFDILFSYKKGLFLYTPTLFLGLLAVLYLLRTCRFFSISWLLFFLLITYVFSSWWMWFYGGSFSSRVYVEFIPIFILPLAVTLEICKPWLKKTIFGLLIFLSLICQVQSYQYRYYEIHYSDMTKEKYWKVFLMRNHF